MSPEIAKNFFTLTTFSEVFFLIYFSEWHPITGNTAPPILSECCWALHCSLSVCSTSSDWGVYDFVELSLGHQKPPGWHFWSNGSCSQSILWGKDSRGYLTLLSVISIFKLPIVKCNCQFWTKMKIKTNIQFSKAKSCATHWFTLDAKYQGLTFSEVLSDFSRAVKFRCQVIHSNIKQSGLLQLPNTLRNKDTKLNYTWFFSLFS